MSSMAIGIIVYAEDKAEANEKALEIVTDLCQRGVFVGHRDMKIMTANSKRGQAFIQERLDVQKQEFMSNLRRLRKHLALTGDEDLWEREYGGASLDCVCMRHWAFNVGQYEGRRIKLYDDDGAGIQTPERLADVLSEETKIYVVSVSVGT